MAKKTEDPGSGIDPTAWMATMSDLTFLLITFFVLLISMSAMDVKFLKEAFGLLSGGTSVLPFEGSAPGPSKTRIQLTLSPLANSFPTSKNASFTKPRILRPEEAKALAKAISAGLTGNIAAKKLQSTLKSLAAKADGSMNVERHKDGLSVLLPGRILFPEGQNELDPVGRSLVDDVAVVLRLWGGKVDVIAHWSWHDGPRVLTAVVEELTRVRVPGDKIRPALYGAEERTIRFVLRESEET